MQRFIKIIVGLILALSLIIILTLIFLPKLVNLTALANYVADQSETRLGRKISIKQITFSVFSGVHIQGVVLANDPGFSAKPLLTIDDLILKYQFWPLLFQHKVLIREIGLDGLNFLLEQRGGLSNLSSLSKRNPPKTARDDEKKDMKDLAKVDLAIKSPVQIIASRVFLKNSNFELLNHNNDDQSFYIKDINFQVSNLSTNLKYSPAKIKGKLQLSGGGEKTNITFDGLLPDNNAAELQLNMDRLVLDKILSPFMPAEKQEPKKAKAKTELSAAETVSGALPLDFMFLQNLKISFIFNLGQFINKNLKVSQVKAKATLDDLKLAFETDATLYKGTVRATLDGNLANPTPVFHAMLNINKVEASAFLKDAYNLEKFVEGSLFADGDFKGEVRWPKKLSGFANVTFRDGRFITGKALGEVGEAALKNVEGKGFKEFFLELKLDQGALKLGRLKANGEGFSIDQSLDLNQSISNMAEQEINKQKTVLQQEIDQKKAEVQQQVNSAVEQKKQELEKQLQDNAQE